MQLGELGWKRGIDLGRVRTWLVFVAALAQSGMWSSRLGSGE